MVYSYYIMDLSQKVRHYYLEHFQELPFDKQFHFATRLHSWNGDAECSELLQTLRPFVVKDEEELRKDLEQLIHQPPTAKINAAAAREQYFERYPDLRGLMLALFRVRHLLSIYDIDARATLLELYPIDKLRSLADAIRNDDDALRVLSTYAINYLYLVDHILYPEGGTPPPVERFYQLADVYDTSEPEQVQLMIYFYTHCIIGESNFYEREITGEQHAVYTKMLVRLESLIVDNYNSINLDNKLEFLVCCRILGYETSLFDKVSAECEQSISSEGMFLIDTHNAFAQSNKTSFSDSEHRNVLFIMSQIPYHS